MAKTKIGIIGATGYTGSELVRLLIQHKDVEIDLITSESRAGESFSEVHPQFSGICDIRLKSLKQLDDHALDIVFLALPHGVSMDFVKEHHDKDFKIIDLSGDFRLSSKDIYEAWYKKDHVFEPGFDKAVLGLPELFRKRIKDAKLVANPGCFPTSATLALAPLIKEGIVNTEQIVIDSKTGVTGAGIKAKEVTHFPNVNDNFKAYGIKTHRHTIEIQETLNLYANATSNVLFTPHLLPVDRGILSTAYTRPSQYVTEDELKGLYKDYYQNEPFIRLRDNSPEIKQVRGTNYCDVFVTLDERTQTIISIGAIDNLVKGAAGQAVQNMNIMLGIDEKTSLNNIPLQP